MPPGPHPRHVEKVHLGDHLLPIFVEPVGEDRDDQLQHARLDGLQFLVAAAAAGQVFQHVPVAALLQMEIGPLHAAEAFRGGPLVRLRPLGVQQKPHAGPVGENGRVGVVQGDLPRKSLIRTKSLVSESQLSQNSAAAAAT